MCSHGRGITPTRFNRHNAPRRGSLPVNDESNYGTHSLFAALAAGMLGPIIDHWIMRYLICALIGLCVSLIADWLRPTVARHGRKVAGERPSAPPTVPTKPAMPEKAAKLPEIPAEDDDE